MPPAATTEAAFSERLKDSRPVALSTTGSPPASGKMRRHPAIEWLARTGYAARGTVFLILGCFTALAATGAHRPLDTKDALRTLLTQPLGEFLLFLVAAGLVCFACWRAVQSILDTDACGSDLRGLWQRIVYAAAIPFRHRSSVSPSRLADKPLGIAGPSDRSSAPKEQPPPRGEGGGLERRPEWNGTLGAVLRSQLKRPPTGSCASGGILWSILNRQPELFVEQ